MSPLMRDWAPVPLRLALGFGFAAHGCAKLSRGPEAFTPILAALGVPQPQLMAGAFALPVSAPLAVVMLTAMFSVHLRYGFSSVRLLAVTDAGARFGPIGYEMNLLYLAGLATLALGGPGRLSVDHWLMTRKHRRK